MAQKKEAGDNYNVASFFMLKLLPPKNGTPALEQKTDKKGRLYLVLHVRDCAGGGTYICNVFNNTGLADKVLALNGGKGLREDEMFLATGSFSSYASGTELKKALRVTSLVSYGGNIPAFGIAGDGNDVSYHHVYVRSIGRTGEVVGRFLTRQHAQGVRFCVCESAEESAGISYACVAFGYLADKIAAQRYAAGDVLSIRGSLKRLADGREIFKMTEIPTVILRKKETVQKEESREEPVSSVHVLTDEPARSLLGGRHFG